MRHSNTIKCLVVSLLFLLGFKGFSQLSKTHYIPPLTYANASSSTPQDQYIYLSTPRNVDIPYTIKPIGQPVTSYITGTVSNNNPQEISIGSGGNTQLFMPSNITSVITNNRGYIIEAEDVIYVSVRMNAGSQAGALVSKGLSALGTTFRIGTYPNSNPQDNYLNFVSVMATEDDTQVDFSNLPAGLIIQNYNGPTPVNTVLDKGESYTLALNSFDALVNRTGLIGCLVNSNKPIAVNCGSANGSFGNGGARDYGIDQIVGVNRVGTEYIFVRGDGTDEWENVLIVAHTNGTAISLNGNPPVATLNAGDFYIIEGDNYTNNGNLYVETSQPAFAYQGVGGLNNNGSPSEANQGMFFVPPLSCETRGNLDNIANINNIGGTAYQGGITVVTKVTAVVTATSSIDGNIALGTPRIVTGKPDYVTYKVKGIRGNIKVESNDELYCAYFNYSGAATSGSFYSGFPSRPEINFDLGFTALGNCIPNVMLEAANIQSFDSFEWWFDDRSGGGFQNLGLSTATITPTLPGDYKLIGIITCTNERLESVEIPVSICPDDRDNDGIIDNIDIDNDNDGILNCTESRGDVQIDLSNIANPEFSFQDGSINSTLASGSYTQTNSQGNTNSFIGNAQGTFTSSIPSTVNAENNYELNFIEPVNLKVSESASTSTQLNSEYFIVSVLPVNKNITLIDQDDRLLIDSNFDGIFETDVTQISGSEIRFRINPNPNGNTPYQFFAHLIDGFNFYHYSEASSNSSISATLSLTCFTKDNDNDGVKDEFDLDSDNDGIPDFIENQGVFVALSGTDANLNGLDDVYDINATPIDTDTDGVWDFYDLDSDNDGITDLIETGQLGTLSDTDLDGVEDGPTYGVNGWTDAAETAPDSNEIGYTPNDFDTDSVFSYIDADSDGDMCSDVIEAGFSDANGDDYLGDNIPTVNMLGLVNNATDGYTLPNSDYLNSSPITITTQPTDITVCEVSDITLSVVSPEAESYQWELSIDGINWVAIVDDAIYSGALSADLTITSTPLTFDGYQYRTKLDRSGNTCGLYSDEIDVTVDVLPIANTAPTIRLCDDDNNGSIPFDLTSQDTFINTQTGMSITYHPTQTDANDNLNVITSPFESSNATIYARVENDVNTSCFTTSSFEIEVYESAFPADASVIAPIQECDNTSVGTDTDGLITFDITQRETEILNGQSPSDFSITYFEDMAYTTQIATPSTFNSTVSGGQTIYVRVTNNLFTDCYTDTSFEIEVFELPLANNPNIYTQCDDDSNDGQALFNLTLDYIKEEINPNHIAEGLVFTYYETQAEAESATNAITNPDAYQDAPGFTPETVWIRVENPNTCFRVVPITLEVNPSSAALASYNPTPKYECDDGSDVRDGISTFDLTDIRDEISTTIFNTINVTVHFYESQMDAELETNEITDISAHQNTNSPNVQTIWVRVKSDLGNDCLGLEEFSNLLNVEALPLANPVNVPRQCDFDTSDSELTYPFNVSLVESNLLNGQSLSDVSISYTYLDQTGTLVTTSTLPNPFVSGTQTMTIRVTNNNTSDPDGPCYDETTLEFIVDEQPIANPVSPQIVCDGDAGDIDDDGRYPFDTSTFQNTILGTQTGMLVFYEYINENGSVSSGETSLPNPLISGNQFIIVEVVNPTNLDCVATTTIELRVDELPRFDINPNERICASNSIDLQPIEENPSEVFDYEWRWTNLSGSITNQLVSNDRIITVSTPGTYTITLTKTDGTGCSRSLDVMVNRSQSPILDETNIRVSNPSYSHTVEIIDPSLLGVEEYEYALQKEGDTSSPLYQNSPVFNTIPPGFYILYARDDNQICDPTALNIIVIGYPQFFTPNGDANNPYWQIKGINATNQPNSIIHIYDRYGKLIKQLSPSEVGWDGTFNGQLMPTDDYWFKVFLQDGRTFMGHFTLKR